MAETRFREALVTELETALEKEDEAEKDYHVRQALQLVELDGESQDGERS